MRIYALPIYPRQIVHVQRQESMYMRSCYPHPTCVLKSLPAVKPGTLQGPAAWLAAGPAGAVVSRGMETQWE